MSSVEHLLFWGIVHVERWGFQRTNCSNLEGFNMKTAWFPVVAFSLIVGLASVTMRAHKLAREADVYPVVEIAKFEKAIVRPVLDALEMGKYHNKDLFERYSSLKTEIEVVHDCKVKWTVMFVRDPGEFHASVAIDQQPKYGKLEGCIFTPTLIDRYRDVVSVHGPLMSQDDFSDLLVRALIAQLKAFQEYYAGQLSGGKVFVQ